MQLWLKCGGAGFREIPIPRDTAATTSTVVEIRCIWAHTYVHFKQDISESFASKLYLLCNYWQTTCTDFISSILIIFFTSCSITIINIIYVFAMAQLMYTIITFISLAHCQNQQQHQLAQQQELLVVQSPGTSA